MPRSSVFLPSILICEQNVRFINYRGDTDYFTVSSSIQPEQTVPLFLGTDVLYQCKQPAANHHGRIHSRFAKMGLATKVTVKGVNIGGISNSSCLWFYSIVGLFRVAFEYLDVEVQRHCLLHMTELWLASFHCKPLPESLTLTFRGVDDQQPNCPQSPVESQHMMESRCLLTDNLSPSMQPSSVIGIMSTANGCYLADDDALKVRSLPVNSGLCSTPSSVADSAVMLERNDEPGQLPKPDERVQTQDEVINNSGVDRLYRFILYRLQSLDDLSRTKRLLDVLVVLLKFFHAEFLADIDNDSEVDDSVDTGFPIALLGEYCELIGDKVDFCSSDGYDVNGRLGVFIHLVCNWLGDQFARLRPIIANRVEAFKAENINRISNLPSPRVVVDQLYPHSMKLLFLRWMGSADLSDLDLSGSRTTDFSHGKHRMAVPGHGHCDFVADSDIEMLENSGDHSYIAEHETVGETSLYAFIQLILEFANGSLVSGIAHVLYPRLMQAHL
jgi:hypothetical protein